MQIVNTLHAVALTRWLDIHAVWNERCTNSTSSINQVDTTLILKAHILPMELRSFIVFYSLELFLDEVVKCNCDMEVVERLWLSLNSDERCRSCRLIRCARRTNRLERRVCFLTLDIYARQVNKSAVKLTICLFKVKALSEEWHAM